MQPLEVQEFIDDLTRLQSAGVLLTHRLDMATRVIELLLARHHTTEGVDFPAAELESADRGFWMRHDKGTNMVHVGLGEPPEEVLADADYEVPVDLPEVREGRDSDNGSSGSEPPLPLDFEGTGRSTATGESETDDYSYPTSYKG